MSVRDDVIEELGRLEEDILYTEKSHFATSESLRSMHYVLGGVAALSSAVAAASAVRSAPVLATVLALVATVTSTLLTFVKPEARSQQHLTSARRLGALRVRIRQAQSLELHPERPEASDRWVALASELAKQKADIDAAAPNLGERSFHRAQLKISKGHFEHRPPPSVPKVSED